MRRAYRGRRSGRNLVPRRWSGDLNPAETAVAAATLEGQVIVTPADYQQGTMEQAGVTLVRIRGQLSLRNVAGVPLIVSSALYVAHEGLATQDPALFAGFIDGDVLWHDTRTLTSAAVSGGDPTSVIELDLKAKRKMREDQLVLALFGTQAFNYSYAIRVLLLGG